MDDKGREHEDDVIAAASAISTQKMAWIEKHTRYAYWFTVFCISLPATGLDILAFPMMVLHTANEAPYRPLNAVTVDYERGTNTSISARDRPLTVRELASAHPDVNADSFGRPGHMAPLRGPEGGVLARQGRTEAALDLSEIAGLPRAGVLCELVEDNNDGSLKRRDGCRQFADRRGIKMISIEMLVSWREVQAKAKA